MLHGANDLLFGKTLQQCAWSTCRPVLFPIQALMECRLVHHGYMLDAHGLYTSVAGRQSCELRILGLIPSGGFLSELEVCSLVQ